MTLNFHFLFLAGKWAWSPIVLLWWSGASKPDQKVGLQGGPFGPITIAKSRFQNIQDIFGLGIFRGFVAILGGSLTVGYYWLGKEEWHYGTLTMFARMVAITSASSGMQPATRVFVLWVSERWYTLTLLPAVSPVLSSSTLYKFKKLAAGEAC